jgi:hypothetical protein
MRGVPIQIHPSDSYLFSLVCAPGYAPNPSKNLIVRHKTINSEDDEYPAFSLQNTREADMTICISFT